RNPRMPAAMIADGALNTYPSSCDTPSGALSGEHLDMISPHPIGKLTFDGVRCHPRRAPARIAGPWPGWRSSR
ncbi:hypothetical protein ACFQ1S_47095, partial [Kibdelosporangium lantanae]